VVIHNLHVIGIAIFPFKTHAPTIIDTDTVLPCPITAQDFKPITAAETAHRARSGISGLAQSFETAHGRSSSNVE